MHQRPSKLLHLPGGSLTAGTPADVVLVDPKAEWTVNPAALQSKSKNTPFGGWTLRGLVKWNFVDGRPVVRNGQLAERKD